MSDIKNQAEQGVVVGLAPLQEKIPRQDIDTFVLDTDVCNLYLLALLELQNDERGKEKQNKFHWYQVAGKPHRSTSFFFGQTKIGESRSASLFVEYLRGSR